VKSTNAIVTPREGGEHLTLIDFGLAREITAPRPALAFGTPAYMAPEILFGSPATPAADQYAAGIVLHEMLTGMPPFLERKGRARARHPRRPYARAAPPARPAAAPGSLDAIVRRALAKHPGERFAGVAEMAGALGALQS